MKKHHLISNMIESKMVVVVRSDSYDEGKNIINACISGGVKSIEVTYSISRASELITYFRSEHTEIIIGAGTVLDSETARIAILSGAQFIVSPIFNKKIAKICNKYSIPYIPGCMTLTECVKAMEYGVDIIKLFPSSALGPSVIKAFKGPIPNLHLMPTGGVDITNIKDWLEAGSIMVGVGGEITKKKNNYSEITDNSKLFLSKIKEWKNE